MGVRRPTIPQLYVSGEFIGGAEIVRQMMDANELQAVLKKARKVCALDRLLAILPRALPWADSVLHKCVVQLHTSV